MCRVATMGAEVQYVSGRKRPVGEMNGKSGNLNSCAAQIYPADQPVPSSELLCILDADQVSDLSFDLVSAVLEDSGRMHLSCFLQTRYLVAGNRFLGSTQLAPIKWQPVSHKHTNCI